jgi:hypothetical protein
MYPSRALRRRTSRVEVDLCPSHCPSAALRFGEIEQRRDVPTRDDAALTHFELPWIEHGQGVFAFVYDRPSRCAAGHPFTEVARVSYGKLDHVPRPVDWLPLDGYLHDCRWLVTRRISSR